MQMSEDLQHKHPDGALEEDNFLKKIERISQPDDHLHSQREGNGYPQLGVPPLRNS